jgi:Helix-turn-helix domain
MAASNSETQKYPMLEAILAIKNLPLQPMYTTGSIAEIFNVSARSVQNWIASGKLTGRSLPGRWKFLTRDVENFLEASLESGR